MRGRALAVSLGVVFVLSLTVVNTRVRGDGNGYFAWLASSVIDGDLDFRNQYRHANALFAERYLDAAGTPLPEAVTTTGYVEDQWSVGPAVLWAPWFLTAHAIAKATAADPQDGFSLLYRRFTAIGSTVYALCALWLSVLGARRLGISSGAAWTAAGAVWGASSLLVYAYLLPFHVHALAAFTVALFIWCWIEWRETMRIQRWAVWGAIAGLMGMTYYVDAMFALLVVPVALSQWRAGDRTRLAVGLLVFSACAVLAAAPQWIGKWIVYGSPITTGYHDRFLSFAPQWWRTALSTNHGVLLWTPIVAIGLAGCLHLARRRREITWLIACAAVFYVVIACYDSWHGLSSFGNRFFVSLTLPIVVGVSVLLDGAWRRGTAMRCVTAVGLAGLILWNAGLAFQWASKMVPSRGPVSVRTVVSQQWAVPGQARTFAWRYLYDREALAREIEAKDGREWDAYRNIR